MKRPLIFVAGIIFFTSIAHGFAGLFESEKTPDVEIVRDFNTHIIPGNSKLSSTVLLLKKKKGVEITSIKSPCPNSLETLYTNKANELFDVSIIELNFPSGSCLNGALQILTSGESKETIDATLSFDNIDRKYEKLLDYSTTELDYIVQQNISKIGEIEQETSNISNKDLAISKMKMIELGYAKQYLLSENSLIQEILNARSHLSYIIPVKGKSMPTRPSKLPNAGRPFRADITDGIHHGWDVDAPIGDIAQAMEDGVIVRIVDNFSWSDFDRIKRGKNLSYGAKTENLDILRGNQVWLKMADGNVVFYAHLRNIAPELYLGKRVKKGDFLGNVGISGVPDKGYNDSHLHFEIALNPHSVKDSASTINEMLYWPYLAKGLSVKGVLSLQDTLFHRY